MSYIALTKEQLAALLVTAHTEAQISVYMQLKNLLHSLGNLVTAHSLSDAEKAAFLEAAMENLIETTKSAGATREAEIKKILNEKSEDKAT